jgi:hypothetical protein
MHDPTKPELQPNYEQRLLTWFMDWIEILEDPNTNILSNGVYTRITSPNTKAPDFLF